MSADPVSLVTAPTSSSFSEEILVVSRFFMMGGGPTLVAPCGRTLRERLAGSDRPRASSATGNPDEP